jgi:hypothetical protein
MNAPDERTVTENAEALPTSSPAPTKLKERIENNLLFFLGTLLTGFLGGLGTFEAALKMVDYKATPKSVREELTVKTAENRELHKTIDASKGAPTSQHSLRMTGVQGFDGNRVRVIAQVNGRSYSYPSQTVWTVLRPDMPAEDFVLPDATDYVLSFRMLTEDVQYGSQSVVDVRQWPFEGTYELFGFGNGNTKESVCEGPTPDRPVSDRPTSDDPISNRPTSAFRPCPIRPLNSAPTPAHIRVLFEVR